jgi:hypothetical protein
VIISYAVALQFYHTPRPVEVRRWELIGSDGSKGESRTIEATVELRPVHTRLSDGGVVRGQAYKLRHG